MFTTRKYVSGVVAAIALGAVAAGCESAGLGVSMPNTGITETFVGKPAPEPNLPERPPLVMPPPNAALPLPGERPQAAALNNPQWPADAGEAKKQAAKTGANDQCQSGGSASDKGNCNPSWIYRVLHPDDEKKTQ
jgi:hypothetical protein